MSVDTASRQNLGFARIFIPWLHASDSGNGVFRGCGYLAIFRSCLGERFEGDASDGQVDGGTA
jgi:hypothetical protein